MIPQRPADYPQIDSSGVIEYLKKRSWTTFLDDEDSILRLNWSRLVMMGRLGKYGNYFFIDHLPTIEATQPREISSVDVFRHRESMEFRSKTLDKILKGYSGSNIEVSTFTGFPYRGNKGNLSLDGLSLKLKWEKNASEKDVLSQSRTFMKVVNKYFRNTYSRLNMWKEKRFLERIAKN